MLIKFFLAALSGLICATSYADSSLPSYSETYFKALEKFLKDKPNASMKEIEDFSKQLNGGGFNGPASTNPVSDVNAFKASVTLPFPTSYEQFRILIVDKSRIQIRVSADTQARVTIDVLASTNQNDANAMIKVLDLGGDRGIVTLSEHARAGVCSIVTNLNGQKSIGGACYARVIVELPLNSPILVSDSKQTLNLNGRPLPFPILLKQLDNTMSTIRSETLNSILSNEKEPRFTAAQVYKIISDINSFDRAEALRALVPLTLKSERAGLHRVIEKELNSFDQDDANSFLEQYNGK